MSVLIKSVVIKSVWKLKLPYDRLHNFSTIVTLREDDREESRLCKRGTDLHRL